MSKWITTWLNLLTFSRADCRRLSYSIKLTSKETFQTCGSLPVFPAHVGKGNRFAADDFNRPSLSLKQHVDFFWITTCISCTCQSRLWWQSWAGLNAFADEHLCTYVAAKEIDLPLMISRGRLCHENNMWISFGSLLVFPARVVSKVVFDGNLGLD